MKCISLQPPWGCLLVHGQEMEYPKDFENRNWPSAFRGRIVIHQSRRFDQEGYGAIRDIDIESWCYLHDHPDEACAYGLIGESTFAEQVTASRPKWFCGPRAWPVS